MGAGGGGGGGGCGRTHRTPLSTGLVLIEFQFRRLLNSMLSMFILLLPVEHDTTESILKGVQKNSTLELNRFALEFSFL